MGAWDVGAFDNDGAGDLVSELRHLEPHGRLALVEDLIDRVRSADYVEVDEAQQVLAAAELVLDPAAAPYSDHALDLPAELPGDFTRRLIAAVDAVLAGPEDSEWFELWVDTDGPSAPAIIRARETRDSLLDG